MEGRLVLSLLPAGIGQDQGVTRCHMGLRSPAQISEKENMQGTSQGHTSKKGYLKLFCV